MNIYNIPSHYKVTNKMLQPAFLLFTFNYFN